MDWSLGWHRESKLEFAEWCLVCWHVFWPEYWWWWLQASGTNWKEGEEKIHVSATIIPAGNSCKAEAPLVNWYELMYHFSFAMCLIPLLLDMDVARPAPKHYQSAFRAPQFHSEFASAVPLTFDSHMFIWTFYMVNLQGKITLVKKSEPETMLVANRWQKFAWQVDVSVGISTGGYLSKGFSKYAFQVNCRILLAYLSAYNFVLLTGCSWFGALCNIPGKAIRGL